MTLTGTYQTAYASKYLQQLCKHFAHKIEATCTETEGSAQFVFGPCQFTASETELVAQFSLTNETATEAAKGVIDSHLQRFAFRENFTQMDWSH